MKINTQQALSLFAINIRRPLAFIDLETTGINVSIDRIVQICILKLYPDQTREVKNVLLNPTIPIPAESSAVHNLYDDTVKDCPTFADVAQELADFLTDCDLAGYNSNRFDIPLLIEEFLRTEVDFDFLSRKMIDVQNIFHKMEKRTLEAAYKFYCNKKLEGAHNAEADILATFEVFEAQLQRYKELENDVDFLHDFTCQQPTVDPAGRMLYNKNKQEIFNFGKYKGRLVEEVFKKEPSYYDWMMNGDFPRSTKSVITLIWKRCR
ncbi:MAG: exonuclease domain-containing protein [Bacteroidia bacterium]